MSWNELQQNEAAHGSVFDAPVTTQKNPLGKCVDFGDGRKFRYFSTAVDLGIATVVSQAAASAVIADGLSVAAIGANQVVSTLAGATLDQYAGGYIHMTDDTGQGTYYRIKGNSAADGSDRVTIDLVDSLLVAIDATTDHVLIKAKYGLGIVGIAAANPLGVTIHPTTAGTDSTTEYQWLQTSGICTVKVQTSTSIAAGARVAAGASGGIVVATATNAPIGTCIAAVDDYAVVDLDLE